MISLIRTISFLLVILCCLTAACAAQAAPNSASEATAIGAADADGHVDRIVYFDQVRKEAAPKAGATSPVKTGVSVILKLAVVLALAYGTILALKSLSAKRDSFGRTNGELKVTDTVKLSQTNSLHVVDFNGKRLLVGSSAGQVNLLREFDGEAAEQTETIESPAEQPTESRFSEYLARYSGASFQNSATARMAGLLRDCAAHLRNRSNPPAAPRRHIIGVQYEV